MKADGFKDIALECAVWPSEGRNWFMELLYLFNCNYAYNDLKLYGRQWYWFFSNKPWTVKKPSLTQISSNHIFNKCFAHNYRNFAFIKILNKDHVGDILWLGVICNCFQ